LGEWGPAGGSSSLSRVSMSDLTVDEGDDILQKLSGVFQHQMKHIPDGVAFRRRGTGDRPVRKQLVRSGKSL
jgi:hypothetical protein